MTVAFDANKGTNGAVKLTSTKADGRFARSWDNVSVPFSTQVDYAVNACPQIIILQRSVLNLPVSIMPRFM